MPQGQKTKTCFKQYGNKFSKDLKNVYIKKILKKEKREYLAYHNTNMQYLVHACMLSSFSCVPLWATLQTVAHQVSLSMGFFR